MLMIDVRDAIARIRDRHTLDDVVGVTLRKMERDGVPPPFIGDAVRPARKSQARATKPRRVLHADPLDGFFAIPDRARAASGQSKTMLRP